MKVKENGMMGLVKEWLSPSDCEMYFSEYSNINMFVLCCFWIEKTSKEKLVRRCKQQFTILYTKNIFKTSIHISSAVLKITILL